MLTIFFSRSCVFKLNLLLEDWFIVEGYCEDRFHQDLESEKAVILYLHCAACTTTVPTGIYIYTPMAADDTVIASVLSGMNLSDAPSGVTEDMGDKSQNNIKGLLHGGEHIEDVNQTVRRQHPWTASCIFRSNVAGETTAPLPRQALLQRVVNQRV
jgi:hypothetical protein